MSTYEAPLLPPDLFCSQVSQQAGEQMVGTAPRVDVWFLLEYDAPWTAKATSHNMLPPLVQHWLDDQVRAVPNGRLQFIKKSRLKSENDLTFFVVLSREQVATIYQFQLDRYEALPTLDIAAVLSGDAAYQSFIRAEPLYLVCTNGKRDRCCALWGLGLYTALVTRLGDAVWQTTHLGGHRFAPTLVTLPDGVYYGRLTPEELPNFIANSQSGRLHLPNYRGRVCYGDVEQAADYFLRHTTGRHELVQFRHEASENVEGDHWHVRFTEADTGNIHHVHLRLEAVILPIYASCGKLETKPIWQYHFSQHRITTPEFNHD